MKQNPKVMSLLFTTQYHSTYIRYLATVTTWVTARGPTPCSPHQRARLTVAAWILTVLSISDASVAGPRHSRKHLQQLQLHTYLLDKDNINGRYLVQPIRNSQTRPFISDCRITHLCKIRRITLWASASKQARARSHDAPRSPPGANLHILSRH